MPRLHRKDEHLYQSLCRVPDRADFSDISFVHNCLPDRDLSEVNLEASYLGRTFRSPLFINALTGGTDLALKINAALAGVAKDCGLPMAVGSQLAALENAAVEESFKVVRRINPNGSIWANIGSYATTSMVQRAVEMITADAVQIHLNVPQELIMGEGDPRFRGMLDRIARITKSVHVPVIAKEVGFGIAREQALSLIGAGVDAIDVGGKGGTNFLLIESRRSGKLLSWELGQWGIPTPISLVEVLTAAQGRVDVIAAGGMVSSLDIAKALALGANAVGMAGLPVYLLVKKGRAALIRQIKTIERELRLIMLMVGATSIEQLQQSPLVITGFCAEWLLRRGIDPSVYALRKRSEK
ncbi:MAG TPA: type 2 isopentenyl-diphosphate Delta-isomerase [Candidatus Limnocylindrales bacterium]|nr:type 2 isopentenyl-diphosphate Delta-isomerase [Candidatus Limnocylindrales bacterium]